MTDDVWRIASLLLTIAFVGLIMVSFVMMVVRMARLHALEIRISRILRRDMLLFGVFAGAFLPTTIDVALDGAADLATNPFWAIGIRLVAVAAISYWTWVEVHLEDPGDDVTNGHSH